MEDYDVLFDLDNTILKSSETIIKLYNEKHNTNYKVNINKLKWDWSNVSDKDIPTKDFLELFDDEKFYTEEYLKVFAYAIECINKLAKNYKIGIITKHAKKHKRRELTKQWFDKTFENVDLIFTDSFSKSEYINSCKVFIDDMPEALEDMKKKSEYVIKFGNFDWNRDYNGSDYRTCNWIRLNKLVRKLLGE